MIVVVTVEQQARHILEYPMAICEAVVQGKASPSLLSASDTLSELVRQTA
jgi:hypothetical protein